MSCSNVVSLDWDMPDYGAMLKKRLEAPTTYKSITEKWCDSVSKRIKSITSLKQKDLKTDGVTFGDSHTIAYSGSGDRVYRTDGKTLFGTIRKGLRTEISESIGSLTLCMGSIDIRHHVLRHGDFSLRYTIKEYVRQGNELADDVWFTAPVPVSYTHLTLPPICSE